MTGLLAWLDDRTGIPSAVRHFLDEEIPGSSGWHQVLGSVALFLFLTQAFTGILLALNYAPTPGDAYNSVRYIMHEVTGGAIIRGLHHWGASMMVIVVVLHMVQVLVWGAYKPPREATWMVGVVLLLITLGYALTGYLLPWDNRAYWGTVVTTQIAGSAPAPIGKLQLQLMGAENGVGVLTFARFYAVHVLVLPPLTALLLLFHVFLVRRFGVAPQPGDESKPKQRFYPRQVFKDTAAIFVAFAILFTLAVVAKAPLGRLADPTDTTYIPRPEWYFLFLFQLLKYFEGPLEVVATLVLPGLAVGLLFVLPFIDRKPAMRVMQRTGAMAAVVLLGIGWAALTVAAIRSTPKEHPVTLLDESGPQEWKDLSPEELAGLGFYRAEGCKSCHALGTEGAEPGKIGPTLGAGKVKRNAGWMIAHFKQPAGMVPGSSMPSIQLSDSQMNALAAFLLKLTPENAAKLEGAPAYAVDGAMIYQKNRCGLCHQVNGVGMKTGPSLNGLSRRRTEDWVKAHFADPQKLSPGSTMPPYKFSPKETNQITLFLLSIQ
jgi:ubiquinol-cytochrome c reductase cytochrome b subunit